MLSKKRLIIIAGVIVLIGGYSAYRYYATHRQPTYSIVEVARGDVTETVSETGNVAAESDITLFFKNTGRVNQISVKEGDAVTAGQPIMKLETKDLEPQRRSAAAALASAQAKYDQALAGATASDIRLANLAVTNASTQLDSAKQSQTDAQQALTDTSALNEASLQKARTDLRGYLESLYLKSSASLQVLDSDVFISPGNLKSDILYSDSSLAAKASQASLNAEAALDSMSADIVRARAAADGPLDAIAVTIIDEGKTIRTGVSLANDLMQGSLPGGSTTQTAFDTRKSNVKTGLSDINSAVNAADSQQQYVASTIAANQSSYNVTQAKLNAANQAVNSAQDALASAQEKLVQIQEPLRDVDKAVYLSQIASAKANLDLLDQQIKDSALTAPVDGIIGTLNLKVGELASPVIQAASMFSSGLQIEADVSELDIAKIGIGSEVTATLDAIGPQVLTGRISEIAPVQKTINEDIYYTVKAVMDATNTPLKPGMTADMTIKVGQKSGVLLVPKRLLIKKGGVTTVQVLRDGKPVEVEIRVGLQGNDNVEVISGLSEGEQLVDTGP